MTHKQFMESPYSPGQEPVLVSWPPKMCILCKEVKPLEEFHNHKGRQDNKTSSCKVCAIQKAKKWKDQKILEDPDYFKLKTDEEREHKKEIHEKWLEANPKYNRTWRLLRAYNINEEEYNRMFEHQEGCCAMCGKHQKYERRALSVDHDHSTGKIRGLLCIACNFAVGHVEKNLDLVIDYLEDPPYDHIR